MFCPRCGKCVEDQAQFCGICGYYLVEEPREGIIYEPLNPAPPRSIAKLVFSIVSLVLGAISCLYSFLAITQEIYPMAVLALIVSIGAIIFSAVASNGGKRGLALAGMITGITAAFLSFVTIMNS